MPFRKKTNRKRTVRRNVRKKRQLVRVQRGLNRPAVHIFRRSITQTIQISTTAVPEGWYASGNNLYKNWGFALNSITSYNDFSDLFKYYKLSGARVQMYFSNTNSSSAAVGALATGVYNPNSQIIMHLDTNHDGEDSASSGLEQTYLDSQTAKKKLCLNTMGRPIDIYMPLKQNSLMHGVGGTGTPHDYATVKPRWIATTEPTTPHYGFKMMLQRVDGQNFTSITSNAQYVKIITTLYIQCKKVQ